MEKDWVLWIQNAMPDRVLETNKTTEKYGLSLTREEAGIILKEQERILKEQRRIDLNGGAAEKIILEFCDSDFINQENYAETVIRLEEIFYLYKNEMQDELTDDELLHLMREQFDELCFGDLDYLEGTCLEKFAEAVRAGYRGFRGTDGRREAGRFDDTARWDYELYLETLRELLWR